MSNDNITPEGVPSIEEHPQFQTADAVSAEAPTGQVPVDVDEQVEPAFGITVVMMPDGAFAIQATGEPNLGEMQMLLSRALKSIEARMIGETVVQIQKQANDKSRIITPGR